MTRIFLAASELAMPVMSAALSGYELLQTTKSQEAERLIIEEGIQLFLIGVHFDDSPAMALVKLIRTDKKHKDTPIIMVRVTKSEIEKSIRQTMETMITLRVINDYLELEDDSLAEVKLRDAVSNSLHLAGVGQNDLSAIDKRRNNLILVVDDSPISRFGTALVVRSLNYEVDEAESGEDALNKLKLRSYAAILMDIQMPGMNGFECTRKIRALAIGQGRFTKIIGFTSSDDLKIEQNCLDAGMDGYLRKSCSEQELDDTLKSLMPKLTA